MALRPPPKRYQRRLGFQVLYLDDLADLAALLKQHADSSWITAGGHTADAAEDVAKAGWWQRRRVALHTTKPDVVVNLDWTWCRVETASRRGHGDPAARELVDRVHQHLGGRKWQTSALLEKLAPVYAGLVIGLAAAAYSPSIEVIREQDNGVLALCVAFVCAQISFLVTTGGAKTLPLTRAEARARPTLTRLVPQFVLGVSSGIVATVIVTLVSRLL